MKLFGISISEEVLPLNLLFESFFLFSNTKYIVVLNYLSLSKSSLTNIVFVNTDHTIVRWEAEFGVAPHDSYLIFVDVKHLLLKDRHTV